MSKPVGFDQKIQRQHLDITANLLRQNSRNEKVVYDYLDEHLLESINGIKSRKNAITMLMKIWYLVDDSLIDLKKMAIQDYPYLTRTEQLFVNYCLVCSAYPFFTEQVSYIGKQFKTADVIYSKTILAHMKDLYGARRRVEVATGAVFSSIKQWELISMIKFGHYQTTKIDISLDSHLLQTMIIEVLMNHYETNSLPLETVNNNAIFFPFDYHINIGDLDKKRYSTFSTVRDTVIERNTQIPYSYE